MNQDNIIDPNNIISFGKYEILYASSSFVENDELYQSKAVQYLNDAFVKFYDVNLQVKINWQAIGKSISSISFLMPKDEAKLGDIFITSPYGLIKKNRTGVGATTLELNSPRNSIIVVPTKALAYNKAKNSKVEIKGTEKYKVLYVVPNLFYKLRMLIIINF